MDSDYDRYDDDQSNQEAEEWYLGEPSNVSERDVLEYASPVTTTIAAEWLGEQECLDKVVPLNDIPKDNFILIEFVEGPIDGLVAHVEDRDTHRLEVNDTMYCYGRVGTKSVMFDQYTIER